MDKKETRTRTCDNCEHSGFIIGKGGYLLEICRHTGIIIPTYVAQPVCKKHRFFKEGGQQ